MPVISDTPVFGTWERESLDAKPVRTSYTAITKAQLAGLLSALGEYAIRTEPEERRIVARHKYTGGCEDIGKKDVIGLREALGRYSAIAPEIEQLLWLLTGLVRAIHAHNALIGFRHKPFTQSEFGETVTAVLMPRRSHLALPGATRL